MTGWKALLRRLPGLGRLVCDHPVIRIVAFGEGATAVYRCTTCRARVDPCHLSAEYYAQSRVCDHETES